MFVFIRSATTVKRNGGRLLFMLSIQRVEPGIGKEHTIYRAILRHGWQHTDALRRLSPIHHIFLRYNATSALKAEGIIDGHNTTYTFSNAYIASSYVCSVHIHWSNSGLRIAQSTHNNKKALDVSSVIFIMN